jgi:hypothetical protein
MQTWGAFNPGRQERLSIHTCSKQEVKGVVYTPLTVFLQKSVGLGF